MNRVAKFEKVSFKEYSKSFVPACNNELLEKYDAIKLPKRATKGSAGYDFFSPITFTLKPGETIKIATGIRCNMKDNVVLILVPRSGQGFKTGVTMPNTLGIIDSDYYFSDNEGHMFIKLENHSVLNKTLEVKAGEAFSQGIFLEYGITEDDDVTEVRNGGFGSTTKGE